jgi:hypothetical protein
MLIRSVRGAAGTGRTGRVRQGSREVKEGDGEVYEESLEARPGFSVPGGSWAGTSRTSPESSRMERAKNAAPTEAVRCKLAASRGGKMEILVETGGEG